MRQKMVYKAKHWVMLALCFTVSIWITYTVTYKGFLLSSIIPGDSLLTRKMCHHNSCIAGLSNWDWFCDHFNASVSCLQTLENSDIPPRVLWWWLGLQQSKDDGQFQKTIQHLFNILQSPVVRIQDIAQCGTCAVVGNSGRLRGSKYGEKIDSHQFVMRMNRAQTAGFEDDVGTRTTHHFMYPESAVNLDPGTHLVLVPFKLMDIRWLASTLSTGNIKKTYTKVQRFIKADKSKVLILYPGFLKYIQEKWTSYHGRYPSTGFITLIFAIHTCTQVSVFGFGADSHGNWHHYWENNSYEGAFHKSGIHDAIFERAIIERLAKEGIVSFYQ